VTMVTGFDPDGWKKCSSICGEMAGVDRESGKDRTDGDMAVQGRGWFPISSAGLGSANGNGAAPGCAIVGSSGVELTVSEASDAPFWGGSRAGRGVDTTGQSSWNRTGIGPAERK
jgi:hypothetical protein